MALEEGRRVLGNPSRLLTFSLSALVAATTTGCGALARRPAPQTVPAAPATPAPAPDPAPETAPDPALQERIAELELRLLERDARIVQLEKRLAEREQMIDETVQEVLRTKAKLRSRESRAEAASAMAEAEIAIDALRAEAGDSDSPELERAEARLRASAAEFEAGNYGGALYAAGQVQGHLREARARLHELDRLDPVAGEALFVTPVPMAVATRSNLRGGPGLEFEVVRTLDAGAAVLAHSYKGAWVRVRVPDGVVGWIHRPLLKGVE